MASEIFTRMLPLQRPGLRCGGRLQDPQLLRDVRHQQRGQGDGEDGGGDEDPHQRRDQGPAGPGGRLQVRVPRAARPRGNDLYCPHCPHIAVFCSQPKRGHIESWWLIGPDTEPGEEPASQEPGLTLALGDWDEIRGRGTGGRGYWVLVPCLCVARVFIDVETFNVNIIIKCIVSLYPLHSSLWILTKRSNRLSNYWVSVLILNESCRGTGVS